jgi:hypothetical protein
MKKFLVSFAVLGLMAASAADSYRITFYQPSIVAGKEFKPGEYKVTVKDGKAMIGHGKNAVAAPVKVEEAENKFNSTSVRYSNGDGKYTVQEIRVGNSNTKIVFQNQDQRGL